MWKLLVALLACTVMGHAQTSRIHSGSTVYIEPMGGYETYLAAALVKKHVPVIIVIDKAAAEYFLESALRHDAPSSPGTVINNSASVNEDDSPNQQAWNQGWSLGQQKAAERAALGYSSASIAIVDPRTSQVIFAYTAGKSGTNQFRKTADDCAKHLKEFIEKSEKAEK